MARQKNIHSEEHLKRLRRSHAEQATGFYKKGGKTRPITKKKPKKRQKIVKRKAKPASAKTPEGFGWQEYGEGMWTKGHQLVGITGDSEVVWLNEKEATDLVVLDFFDAYDEAVEWAKTWITENPDGLPEDAETEPEVIGTSGGVDISGRGGSSSTENPKRDPKPPRNKTGPQIEELRGHQLPGIPDKVLFKNIP